jgi:hypothetical membrane protein
MRPGYSHVSQYISELGESGSTTATLMRDAGFFATGLMHIGFAAVLLFVAGRGRATVAGATLIAIDGVCRIGAGAFPCDPGCAPLLPSLSQELHGAFARTGFLAMTAVPVIWGLSGPGDRAQAGFCRYSLASGVMAFGLLVAVVVGSGERVGLYELLASATLSVWLFVFALRITGKGA